MGFSNPAKDERRDVPRGLTRRIRDVKRTRGKRNEQGGKTQRERGRQHSGCERREKPSY